MRTAPNPKPRVLSLRRLHALHGDALRDHAAWLLGGDWVSAERVAQRAILAFAIERRLCDHDQDRDDGDSLEDALLLRVESLCLESIGCPGCAADDDEYVDDEDPDEDDAGREDGDREVPGLGPGSPLPWH